MNAPAVSIPISLFQRVNAELAKSADAKEALRACAARIHACGDRMIADCLAIGKELLAARGITRAAYDKGAVEGEWLRFLDETVKMPRTQALRFIQVYERYGVGVPRGTPLPDASFRVLAELAAPEADPEVVATLEKRIAKGERVTVRQAAKAKRKPKAETVGRTSARPAERVVRNGLPFVMPAERVRPVVLSDDARAEIERRVSEERDRYLRLAEKAQLESAQHQAAIAGAHRFMTQDECRLVLSCLHPDKPDRDQERLARAFAVMRRVEVHVASAANLRELKEHGWFVDLDHKAFQRAKASEAS